MQVIGRKDASFFLKLCIARAIRLAVWVHATLAWQQATLTGIADAAGGYDILPGCPTAFAAGDNMIEGQFWRRFAAITILAAETIAQKDVKPGESGIGRGRHIFPQRDHAGQAHLKAGGMHDSVIFGKNINTLQENGLDSILP